MAIELQKYLSPGVAGVLVDERKELWVRCTARKKFRCALCETEKKCGHQCWRTTSNGMHRAKRICVRCWGGDPP